MKLTEARLSALKTQIEDIVYDTVAEARQDEDSGIGVYSDPAADKIIDVIKELVE